MEIAWRFSMGIVDLCTYLEFWGEKSPSVDNEEDLVSVTARALKQQILQAYGGEALDHLAHIGGLLVDQPPETIMDTMLPHAAEMTWDNLIQLGQLAKEYNLEWALAAMEWK